MTIAIAVLLLFVVAGFALRETMRDAQPHAPGSPAVGPPQPSIPAEAVAPPTVADHDEQGLTVTGNLEPVITPAEDLEPATLTSAVALDVGVAEESAQTPLPNDILPAGAPVTELVEDGHLLATRIALPVEPHERSRAVFKLVLVLVFVAGACGAVLLLVGRLVGDYFTRFTG